MASGHAWPVVPAARLDGPALTAVRLGVSMRGVAKEAAEGTRKVGCAGLLWVPFPTIRFGAFLLATGGGGTTARLGPYRQAASPEGAPVPLTPTGNRIIGAVLLLFTLVLPGAVAARAVYVYWPDPVGLAIMATIVWVLMMVGHLLAIKVFGVLEPRLPHRP